MIIDKQMSVKSESEFLHKVTGIFLYAVKKKINHCRTAGLRWYLHSGCSANVISVYTMALFLLYNSVVNTMNAYESYCVI